MIPKVLLAEPRVFVDRVDERAWIDQTIADGRAAGRQTVIVLAGLPGVGKTTLAAQCSHKLKELLPGGCLLVSFGSSTEPVSTAEAHTNLLWQLGVEKVPPAGQARRDAYLAATADRALLVVLDDIESAAQLRNLLPASSNSVVIATSRRRSEGFARERFSVLTVPPLSAESSAELISLDVDGSDRDAVRALAEVCGHLPLALSIASAHVSTRHHGSVAACLERLRASGSVLSRLTIDGEQLVKSVFEVSYQDLPEPAQRAYRLLSLHPGRQFGADAAAALLDVPDPLALLESLSTATLLDEPAPGRYEFHSLVHQHADGHAAQERPGALRAALTRLVEHYLTFAVARYHTLSDRPGVGAYFDGRVPTADGGYQRAMADLELERQNLRRVVRAAVEEGTAELDELAWQLCEALATSYFQRDLWIDSIAVHTDGLLAAQRIYDRTGESEPLLAMHAGLGAAYFSAGDNETAFEHFEHAERLGDGDSAAARFGTAKMLSWKAFVYQRRDEIAAAVAAVERARTLVAELPQAWQRRELALLDMNGAPMLSKSGRHEDAVAAGRRALRYFEDGKEPHNAAKSLANLGESLANAGDPEAVATLSAARKATAAHGLQSWEAHVCELLAAQQESAGLLDEARSSLRRARELYEALGD